jgi:hypothetical protein
MACKSGCAKRFRQAAVEAGWVLHDDGWWRHPELSPDVEAPFRDVVVDSHHSKLAVRRPSIRRKVFGVVTKAVKKEVKSTLDNFLNRMGLTDDMVSEILVEEEGAE